jgi:hypothetical protein
MRNKGCSAGWHAADAGAMAEAAARRQLVFARLFVEN